MIEFRVLGPIELHGSTSSRRDLDAILAQPKRTALLAYLALASSGDPQRRDRLVGVFWPEFSQSRARAALRRALSFLRTRLGSGVFVTRGDEVVGLSRDRFRCDALSLQRALREGQRERALALYGGPLLDGFFVRDVPEFERWLESLRWRLQSAATRAAIELAEAAERSGDLSGAADRLRRALEIAPADEGALRRLVSVLARAGERTEAIRAFEDFRRQAAETYDMAPSVETRRLVAAVTAGVSVRRVGPSQPRPGACSAARDLVAEALGLVELSESDNQRAIDLSRRAIYLDESCAEAYASLAAAHAHGVQLFGRPRSELRAAVQAARTAVSLDSSLPEAHFALGLSLEMVGHLAEAEGAYRNAVALEPSSGLGTAQLGRLIMMAGNFAESLRWARQSFRLAPEDPHTSLQIALDLQCLGLHEQGDRWHETTLKSWPEFLWAEASWAYFALAFGDLPEAERRARRMLARNAESFLGRFTSGMTAVLSGDAGQASPLFESLYAADPTSRHGALLLSTRSFLAYLKLEDGDRACADELLRDAELANLGALARGCHYGGIFYDQATIYALKGEDVRALDWLEASKAAGYLQPDYMRRDPLLEPLRRYDRFARLLKALEAEVRDQREAVKSLIQL